MATTAAGRWHELRQPARTEAGRKAVWVNRDEHGEATAGEEDCDAALPRPRGPTGFAAWRRVDRVAAGAA
jgi:hypothetical protein